MLLCHHESILNPARTQYPGGAVHAATSVTHRLAANVVEQSGLTPHTAHRGWTNRSRAGTKVVRSRCWPLSPSRPWSRSQPDCVSWRRFSHARRSTASGSAATIYADAHGRLRVQPSASPEFCARGDALSGAPRLFRNLRSIEPSWLGPADGQHARTMAAFSR
jgi:hypothetical protein